MTEFRSGRTNKVRTPGSVRLLPGQVWQSSDPRRRRAVLIESTTTQSPNTGEYGVYVSVIYPEPVRFQRMSVDQFYQLGSKGYDRVR